MGPRTQHSSRAQKVLGVWYLAVKPASPLPIPPPFAPFAERAVSFPANQNRPCRSPAAWVTVTVAGPALLQTPDLAPFASRYEVAAGPLRRAQRSLARASRHLQRRRPVALDGHHHTRRRQHGRLQWLLGSCAHSTTGGCVHGIAASYLTGDGGRSALRLAQNSAVYPSPESTACLHFSPTRSPFQPCSPFPSPFFLGCRRFWTVSVGSVLATALRETPIGQDCVTFHSYRVWFFFFPPTPHS